MRTGFITNTHTNLRLMRSYMDGDGTVQVDISPIVGWMISEDIALPVSISKTTTNEAVIDVDKNTISLPDGTKFCDVNNYLSVEHPEMKNVTFFGG